MASVALETSKNHDNKSKPKVGVYQFKTIIQTTLSLLIALQFYRQKFIYFFIIYRFKNILSSIKIKK